MTTVKELIEKLQSFDPTLNVVIIAGPTEYSPDLEFFEVQGNELLMETSS